jgi:hypothetical protein
VPASFEQTVPSRPGSLDASAFGTLGRDLMKRVTHAA